LLALLSLSELPLWLKRVAGVAAVGVAIYWLWLVLSPRIRLRSPITLVRSAPTNPGLQSQMDSTRKLKTALLEFFHAWANPAMQAALAVAKELHADMQQREEPWPTCAQLFQVSIMRGAESAEGELRTVLEGSVWDMTDIERLKAYQFEQDVKKQKPSEIAWAFHLYTMDYRVVVSWIVALATALRGDPDRATLQEWRKKDERYREHAQALLGMAELGEYRDAIGEQI
jgi:hypothetical protein